MMKRRFSAVWDGSHPRSVGLHIRARPQRRLALRTMAAAGVATCTVLGGWVVTDASASTASVTTWAGLQTAVATSGTVTLTSTITAPSGQDLVVPSAATVNLDLDGHTLTVASPVRTDAGIEVEGSLTIETTHPGGGGTLSATGGRYGAGIGGGYKGSGGTITISGGTVTAHGGTFSAGIGGGTSASDGTVTITGGTVTATGGTYGAGIGGGYKGSGGTIAISGGTVTAHGGTSGAGIGGGDRGSGGAVTISGASTVHATGGTYGAGIGGGALSAGGAVTIEAGTVTATGGPYAAGIGGGTHGAGGPVTIDGGTVTAIAGNAPASASAIGAGYEGSPFGSLTNGGSLTLEGDGEDLLGADVTNNTAGVITLDTALTGGGKVANTGTLLLGAGGSVTGGVTITEHDYALSFAGNGVETSPGTEVVYASSFASGDVTLPTAPTNYEWADTATVPVTANTDLTSVFGESATGATDATLYLILDAPFLVTVNGSSDTPQTALYHLTDVHLSDSLPSTASTPFPAGTVSFYKTSTPTPLCEFAVTHTLTACSATLGVGTYVIHAHFAPSTAQRHPASTSTIVALTILEAPFFSTTWTIAITTASSAAALYGTTTRITLSETDLPATGAGTTVAFYTTGTPSQVLCSFVLSAATTSCRDAVRLAPGTYTIRAQWPGTADYYASTSPPVTLTVLPPPAGRQVNVHRIYGTTADGTAAAELAHAFTPSGRCPGTQGSRPVVLATDATFPDALSSAYLAKDLSTGTLLTPTASLSEATLAALRSEGITHVYVVGGPLAVSTAVVAELEATPAYACGGESTLGAEHLSVTRIFGTTADGTAEKVAELAGQSAVGSADLGGAYATTNAAGGGGRYNDTAGTASAAPSAAGALRTAIVASNAEFQDAEAAATLSYAEDLPILLTGPASLSTQAKAAISALHIAQVVLMGGPLAVATAVVTQLENLGVSVLRVAGMDYTDTAIELADLEVASVGTGFAWHHVTGITVARGDAFSDGLAGAVVAATGGWAAAGPEPLVLTESPETLGHPLAEWLRGVGANGIDGDGLAVNSVTVLGGPLALTTYAVSQMTDDLTA